MTLSGQHKAILVSIATNQNCLTLAQLNALGQAAFTDVIGPVFEHSPWIAAQTWNRRPFASREQLHGALCTTVRSAGVETQLALIRAHPDLVGRAALAGTLTAASTREQAAAGLDQLSPAEVALFQQYNRQYQTKFGFPFVICARLNRKSAILAGFERRLQHSREQEIVAALAEIDKIAGLRLADFLEAGAP
jgi:2-oxo-4-hydroxy-4-carboxy-5-ureidoimidazoline decarboxylase